MILIVSFTGDPSATRALPILERRGAKARLFDPTQFPSARRLTLRYAANGAPDVRYVDGDDEVRFADLQAVWYRKPVPARAGDAITDEAMRKWVTLESEELLGSIWDMLPCRVLPAPPPVLDRARKKPAQLALAGSLGFALPPTLVSNDPDELIAFYREHEGRVITKLIYPKSIHLSGLKLARFTEMVTSRDIGYFEAARHCPVLAQAYVPKSVELRITVVGERVFAAEIHSQRTRRTRFDYRRYDHRLTPYGVHQLPPAIAEQCVALTRRLGLLYGAIDMIVTPDGQYVFLEINPNGQYAWIEDKTGMPITSAICDLLLSTEGAKS